MPYGIHDKIQTLNDYKWEGAKAMLSENIKPREEKERKKENIYRNM